MNRGSSNVAGRGGAADGAKDGAAAGHANRRQSVAPGQMGLGMPSTGIASKRSFHRKKSVSRVKRDTDGDSPRSAQEANESIMQLNRLRQQFDQLRHRLESEGKKVAENTNRIEQLEFALASIEQQNTREIGEHDIVVAVETEKLEDLQEQLSEALRLRDELTSAVSEMVDGDTLKKRSNQLRMEQLVNFVLSNASELMVSADDIDRDITGERVRALAKYEEREHAGKELRVTFQRRRELWENYEYLWLREGDPSLKPKFSNFFTSYYDMLEPHRCRWNNCVLDRCATEYMASKRHAWSSFVASSESSGAPGVSMGGALALCRAAKRFRGAAPPRPRAVEEAPSGDDDAPQRRAVDAQERFFPHRNRR